MLSLRETNQREIAMENTTDSTFRPRFTKFGVAEDYTGAQVLTVDNRLAEIVRVYYRELPSTFMCELKHFNGERFEQDQALSSLRILDRNYNA